MSQLRWQKSSFSAGGGENCVELATDATGTPHLRESGEPQVVIATTLAKLCGLFRHVKAGQFDRLAN